MSVADAHHLLTLVRADGGYTGSLVESVWPRSHWSCRSSNAATTEDGSWCCPSGGSVERLFAWLGHLRAANDHDIQRVLKVLASLGGVHLTEDSA
ncbi:hypothetical protein ACFWP7_08960 [Streptomyces sp. NPDC058470]|uniref:hypothetical protein n=1 Tax=Streptomyces sp. NPDC058470 TaxID=3346515 RepID=UPI0036464412